MNSGRLLLKGEDCARNGCGVGAFRGDCVGQPSGYGIYKSRVQREIWKSEAINLEDVSKQIKYNNEGNVRKK